MNEIGHPGTILLSDYALGRENADVTAHLPGCRTCRGLVADYQQIRQDLLDAEKFDAFFTDFYSEAGSGREIVESLGRFQKKDDRRSVSLITRLAELAKAAASRVLNAVERDLDEATVLIREEISLRPECGLALAYACQEAGQLVPRNPGRFLRFAELLLATAPNLLESGDEAPPGFVSREQLLGEALLLASQAENRLGNAAGAKLRAQEAREQFRRTGDTGFCLALCDYFEAVAASFARDYPDAEALLRAARRTFRLFRQDHWVAQAEAALGTLVAQTGDHDGAVPYFERAAARLDPELDRVAYVNTLVNKATSLSHLSGYCDQARAIYAKALKHALRHDLRASLQAIRNGLAEADFKRGDYDRALSTFSDLATAARAAGFHADYLFAQLYAAECLGRLGRVEAMHAAVDAIRQEQTAGSLEQSPAFEELFCCLDQGALGSGIIAHVRRYLDGSRGGRDQRCQSA